MKTAKFGGTSLADAARFRQVKRIVSADPELRFVVVSAPGKRSAEDKKVTDLLYDCHAAVKTGTDPETAFAPVAARFRQIVQELDLAIDLESELRQIEAALASGASEAYCVSRGEYLSGRMLAALLGWPFLDPAELHFFDADGFPQHKLAERSLTRRLRDMERAVMPGFYGGGADGRIHTLPRGGSDISGALLASAAGSDAYENWTDVAGIFRADPAIVPSARAIPAMAYDEVRELAYMGANVLHEDAVTPARRMGIPIHIRSTMQPDTPGTLVSSQSPPSVCPVTGIAGRKGYCSIQVEKENMNSAVGYCAGFSRCSKRTKSLLTTSRRGLAASRSSPRPRRSPPAARRFCRTFPPPSARTASALQTGLPWCPSSDGTWREGRASPAVCSVRSDAPASTCG